MPTFKVKVKWGKELYKDVEVNTDEEPLVFKAQLFALTGVEPHRQKVMVKGQTIKDGEWGGVKVKEGATLLLMGSKEEDIPVKPAEATKFVEDMDESELQSALEMPAGLQNLGNTCYMNATVQCLKTVPEFKSALMKYEQSISLEGGAAGGGGEAQSITAAMRDLFRSMDRGKNLPPIVMLQVMHMAFPRFAEKAGEGGGFKQQDANECWVELLGMLKQKLPSENNDRFGSAVDQYFGITFDAELKCVESEEEEVTKSQEHFLQYNCYIDKEVKYLHSGLVNRLKESLTKNSPTLGRDAEYIKSMKVSRLPGYLTVQMVRFQFKQKDAINAKILKDVKFPLLLDAFDVCSPDMQQKLIPMRKKFKEYEDKIVEENVKTKSSRSREEALKKSREAAAAKAEAGAGLHDYWFEDDVGSNNSGYYELQAVLTHKGRSSDSGHYVAWVKHKGDTWIECNDDDIRPIHVDDVMKLSGGGDWHTAYLLVYGPRRLPREEGEKKEGEEGNGAAASTVAAEGDEKPMETS